jgi:phosphatidylserine/phosphatidylglycerophosphate/cardiolipin synthase-like enzyme
LRRPIGPAMTDSVERRQVSAFASLFNPTPPQRLGEVTVTLADPTLGAVAVPPVAARHAGHRIVLLHVRAAATTDLVSPARAVVRRVQLGPATPLPGITELLEISPLPFNTAGDFRIEPALRKSTRGLPTFYVAPFGTLAQDVTLPEVHDAGLDQGTTIETLGAGAECYVGVLFQDGVSVLPRSAFEIIGHALEEAGDGAGATGWRTQLDALFGPARHCRVVGHDGTPLDPDPLRRQFVVAVRRDGDLTVVQSGTVTLGADDDLEAALAASPIGSLNSLFSPPADHHVAIQWRGEPKQGESLAVHAIYDTGDSAPPRELLRLPATLPAQITINVLELANWFPELAAGLSVARFHTNSLVLPLVDGITTYRELIADIKAAMRRPSDPVGPQLRIHLAAWTLNRFELDPTTFRTDIVEIAEDMVESGGSMLVLATKFFNLKDPTLDETRMLAVLLLLVLVDGSILVDFIFETVKEIFNKRPNTNTNDAIQVVWYLLPAIATVLGEAATQIGPIRDFILSKLEGVVERGRDTVEDLQAIPGGDVAMFSVNPFHIADNPLKALYGVDPLFNIENDCDQFNVYHNKVQMVRRRADERGDEFVGYLGGIDVNANRFDSPGHQIGSPYHDVHSRISGPVVADVFESFYERWARDSGRTRADLAIELPPPVATDMPAHAERHIARIGRTYPKTTPGFSFAPNGDRTIYDTLLAAIDQARDYIYIEEQYFTPDDPFVDALAAAEAHCKRLLITVPSETDQPFGDLRRRHVFDRLRDAWQERVLIGFPQRRPMLARADRFASRGRAFLVGGISSLEREIHVAPPARAVAAPFWLFVDGELMLARDVVSPVEHLGTVCARLVVERGGESGDPRWGAAARSHRGNTPVTFSQVKGIYVHAKCMMVDDVFVSIGSTNLNRRGFFSDGEINVFAVPERLHGAPNNPARALRTGLWAEHLGIPPAMGSSLLRDPIAALDRFYYPQLAGNRFAPITASDIKPMFGIGDASLWPLAIAGLVAQMVGAAPAVFFRRVWNLVIEPTTGLDLDAKEGPV